MPNTNLMKVGADPSNELVLYPNTNVGMGLPIIGGRLAVNMPQEDRERIEKFFNKRFDTPDGIKFYDEEINIVIPSHLTSLNIKNANPKDDDIHDLLTYYAGIQLGFIAENQQKTLSPICHALCYVYDAKGETTQKTSIIKDRSLLLATLVNLYENDARHLIAICKEMFGTFSEWNKDNALDKLSLLLDDQTNLKENIAKVQSFVNIPRDTLLLDVDIKEAMSNSRRIIRRSGTGIYYNTVSNTEYGRTHAEIRNFLLENIEELEGAAYSIRTQLSATGNNAELEEFSFDKKKKSKNN